MLRHKGYANQIVRLEGAVVNEIGVLCKAQSEKYAKITTANGKQYLDYMAHAFIDPNIL